MCNPMCPNCKIRYPCLSGCRRCLQPRLTLWDHITLDTEALEQVAGDLRDWGLVAEAYPFGAIMGGCRRPCRNHSIPFHIVRKSGTYLAQICLGPGQIRSFKEFESLGGAVTYVLQSLGFETTHKCSGEGRS